ncbi:MAG: cold shock domain-containing protein [Candidatus Theseobacter exili]|nr:cold shock domain-containing protein [Candidatus Theseobacter exili]
MRDNMELKGKLVRWNEDRGFGFIKSNNIKGDIFIHISALKKMSRRPRENYVIFFKIATDEKGKKKAVNAKIEGVTVRRTNNYIPTLLVVITAIAGCFYAYTTFSKRPAIISETLNSIFAEEDFSGYSCQGKQYCNQMTSCKEARFYLKNCPNVKIDGNHDGTPCESQWCN